LPNTFFPKFNKLAKKEILYLFPAFFLLLVFKIAIKLLPFNILQTNFQKLTNKPYKEALNEKEVEQKATSINRIAYYLSFFGFTCLPKAMAMKYWLKNSKHIALHFGVQKDSSNNFIAHAWVTKSNITILGDDPNTNYKSIWVWE
jgi:Transglutaminase-like superfamily